MRFLFCFTLFALLVDGCTEPPPAPPPPPPAPLPALVPLPPPPSPPLDVVPAPHRADGYRDIGLRDGLHAVQVGEVPQVDDAFELFELAAAEHEDLTALDGGLLICDVRVSPSSGADTHKGPDLSLQVRAGDTPRGRNLRGAEDTWAWTMSMPVARLRPGDPVWVRVVDRDTWSDEYLGARSTAFRAFPLRFRMEHARVECRGLPRSRFRHRVERAVRDLDRAVDRLVRRVPDADAPELGWPSREVGVALRELRALTTWVPWDDPLVAPRVAILHAWEESFDRRRAALVADLVATLPSPDVAPPPDLWPDGRIDLVDAEGHASRAGLVPADLADWPAARARIAARAPRGVVLLRVTRHRRVTWHRLE